MIETFYARQSLDTPLSFFAALLIGAAFGFALERAGFGSSRRLAGAFYFKDMAVIKVMFSAMLTAMLGIALLTSMGFIPAGNLHFMETVYGAHAVGGLLFGVGFVMSGWCPGTAAVGLASGKWDALAFLVGLMLGAVAFSESFAWIKPLYNWGLQSEPRFAFGIPIHLFAFGFTIVGVAAFYFSEWIEQQVGGKGEYLQSPFLKAFSVATVAIAASLFVFPATNDTAHAVARPVPENAPFTSQALLVGLDLGTDHIEPEMLAEKLVRGDTSVVLIDIRHPVEFQRFHIRGAINIPLTEVIDELEAYRHAGEVVLYSNGMTHPAEARDQLAMRGFTNVFVLTDGLQGFLDQCLRPASLYNESLSDVHVKQIANWRSYFGADTTCPPESLNQLSASHLQPVVCGSIAKLNTLGGIYLASQPFPDDLRLARQGGMKTVVSLRFPDEIDWDEAAVAQQTGLAFFDVPFKAPETLTDEVFERTRMLLSDQEKQPLLLHCHSGNRVGAIWLAHRVLDDGLSLVDAEKEAATVGLKSPDYLAKAKDYIRRSSNQDQ